MAKICLMSDYFKCPHRLMQSYVVIPSANHWSVSLAGLPVNGSYRCTRLKYPRLDCPPACKFHNNTIQVYSVTVMSLMTHVKALEDGQSSQGTSEPISPGMKGSHHRGVFNLGYSILCAIFVIMLLKLLENKRTRSFLTELKLFVVPGFTINQ